MKYPQLSNMFAQSWPLTIVVLSCMSHLLPKPFPLNPDQRGAIIGMTGSGKSVLATSLVPTHGNVCIIDPKRMFDAPEYQKLKVYDSVDAVRFWQPKRFIYRPKESLLTDIDAYGAIYEQVYKRGQFFCYTDDVVGIMDRARFPHQLQVCYQMGRAKKVCMLSSFQRPANVPRFLMTEASKIYAFRLTMKDDIKRIQEFCLGYDPALFVKPYQFAFYETGSHESATIHRIAYKDK